MAAAYQKRSNVGVGVGLLTQIVGKVLMMSAGANLLGAFGAMLAIGGAILFIWGCGQFAIAKGYSGVLGLLGLLSFLGLIALVAIPVRRKKDLLS
jgi:hypothetical protein